MKRRAFTLIELLVVIAIISLLVSILLPSLQKAKDLAKNVTCLSQIKGFGFAINSYLDDNSRHLPDPPSSSPLVFYYSIQSFVEVMNPYLGAEGASYNWGAENPNPNKMWYCTSDIPDSFGFEAPWHGSSYNYTWQYRGQSIDGGVVQSYMGSWWEWRYEDSLPSEAPLMNDQYSHLEQGLQNVLYADFHASSEAPGWGPWYPMKG